MPPNSQLPMGAQSFPADLKVALITGASSGIGKAAAAEFGTHGFCLVLSGRNESALKAAAREAEMAGSPKAAIVVGDVRKPEIAEQLISMAEREFGRLDVLINNAGIFPKGTITQAPLEVFDEVMDVNVRSAIRLTKLAIPMLIANKGTVVNVSSLCAVRIFLQVPYYCMSKAALDQFTRCLALELAPKGVRVNSVNPGVIDTDIHRRSGLTEEQYQMYLQLSKDTHPLGRHGTADEVARGIYFLASDGASFTTGCILMQDGGRYLTCVNELGNKVD